VFHDKGSGSFPREGVLDGCCAFVGDVEVVGAEEEVGAEEGIVEGSETLSDGVELGAILGPDEGFAEGTIDGR